MGNRAGKRAGAALTKARKRLAENDSYPARCSTAITPAKIG